MYPPHVPHGLAGHDLSALVNPSLQQGLSKPSVIAQVVDHSGSGHYDCASETNAYIGLLELSLRLGNSGQDPGIETAAPISEVGPDSCDPLSDRSSQALGDTYLTGYAWDAYTYQHRLDYFHYQHVLRPPHTQFSGGESPSRFYPGFEETHKPYGAAAEPQAHFDHGQVPSAFVGAVEHPNQSLFRPVGIEEKQVIPWDTTESSSAGVDTIGIQNPNKRKRETTPDLLGGECEGKRIRRKKPRNLQGPQENIPVDPSTPLSTRPTLRAVEQTKYQCEAVQKNWEPLPPITFHVQGNEGINLVDALDVSYSHLERRDDPMFTGGTTGGSILIRMEFVGHQAGNDKARQIATTNHRRTHDPITRQKLAREVAKLIEAHLKKGKNLFHVPFEDMFLVRLHNVSQASWQPELWYKGPASTRP